MNKQPIDLTKEAYRLLNPGSVVLVSVGDGKRDNLFAVTWNMPIRKDPGMLALVSGKGHFSYDFIARTGELGVNIPCSRTVDAVYKAGTCSGRDIDDKFAHCGLTRLPSEKIKAPLVAEAVAHLECKICQVVDLGSSSLLIAQIVAGRADPDLYAGGKWNFGDGLGLIHHLGGDQFAVSERVVTAVK